MEPIVNPWLREQIDQLRSAISEEELRGRYEAAKEADPEKPWSAPASYMIRPWMWRGRGRWTSFIMRGT